MHLALFVLVLFQCASRLASGSPETGVQYYMNSRLVNWIDAQEQCRSLGQSLVTIPDKASAISFRNWLRRTTDYANAYWIGGTYVGGSLCEKEDTIQACWKWIDNENNVIRSIDLEKIKLNFLGNSNGSLVSRVTLAKDRYNEPHIGAAENTTELKFICESRSHAH